MYLPRLVVVTQCLASFRWCIFRCHLASIHTIQRWLLTMSCYFSRMAAGRRSNNSDTEPPPPPPPTMAQVLLAMEANRNKSNRLLEQLVRNLGPRNNTCNTLTDFLWTQPPQFSSAKEPLEADDWLLLWNASLLLCMFQRLSMSTLPPTNCLAQLEPGGRAMCLCHQ